MTGPSPTSTWIWVRSRTLRATPFFAVISVVSLTDANSRRPKRRDGTLSPLNAATGAMDLAKGAFSMTSPKAAFGSVTVIQSGFPLVSVGRLLADAYRAP